MARILGLKRIRTLLGAVLVLSSLAGALPAAVGGPDRAQAAAYGPQLFLLGPSPIQVEVLPALPATIHAVLYGDGPEFYVASGGPDLPDRAAAGDIPAKLLDADTSGKTYYFVDAQAEGASDAASEFGTVIYADARQLLLAVPAENEPRLLETLPGRGIGIAVMPPAAIALPEEHPSAPSRPAVSPGAAEGAAADPAIAALLRQITEQAISDRIAELSGARAADIGGGTATLATRYTFAAGVRNAEAYLYRRYADLGVPVSYVAWNYSSYSGRNVVAEIRGTIHPERLWLVGGHFDDISETPYSRAPGADDNASGTAATLVLASILREHRFADTIRFVHFSGEEQGQWGSRAYARSLSSAGSQVMGFIDLDMIGWDGNGDRTMEIHSGTRANSVDLASRFVAANQRYGQDLRIELKQGSASRFSDHSPFWDHGYPAFLAIENFFDDTIPADRNPWYHNTGDLLSRIDLGYVTRTARTALAVLAESAAIDPGPAPAASATPTATRTSEAPAPTPTRTPTAASCSELVANGSFEANAAWTFAATANPGGYTAAQAHSGLRSARLGVVAGSAAANERPPALLPTGAGPERNLLGELAPLGAGYSTAYQTITVPAARAATLSFWYRPGSQATSGDHQRVLLLRPGTYGLIATVMKTLANAGAWQAVTFDLTPYRGQSLVVYFEVYNDDISAGPRTWMFVDDVSVQACSGATSTPAATQTPTVTRTPTPAASPTSTATATPAHTPTPTPTAARTPTPSACSERVSNGGFEANTAWFFAATGNPGGYTTAQAHTGARSARLGVVPGSAAAGEPDPSMEGGPGSSPERNPLGELAPAGASYSTAYQTISIPAEGAVTLAFWYKPGTQAAAGDYQRVLLLKPGSYALLTTLVKMLRSADEWQWASFDLSAYRGQSVVLYFEVYNDDISSGPTTWMFVDDVSVQACSGA